MSSVPPEGDPIQPHVDEGGVPSSTEDLVWEARLREALVDAARRAQARRRCTRNRSGP